MLGTGHLLRQRVITKGLPCRIIFSHFGLPSPPQPLIVELERGQACWVKSPPPHAGEGQSCQYSLATLQDRSPFDAEKVTVAQLYQHVPLFFFVILKRVFYNLEVEDSVLEEEDEDLQEVAAVPAAHLHHSCGHLWHCSRHITESMAVRYSPSPHAPSLNISTLLPGLSGDFCPKCQKT